MTVHAIGKTGLFTSMLVLLSFWCMQAFGQQPIFASGQIQEDTRIRTLAYPLGQGALNLPGSAIQKNITSAPFGTDGFVGVATTIHTDERSEAFNAHRMNGFSSNFMNESKIGTWVEYFRFAFNSPFMVRVDNRNRDNFFTASFPRHSLGRHFSGTLVNRGYSKVEYICPSACGASNVSAYYFKIGGWDMYTKAWRAFNIPSQLNSGSIINLDAVIHSDRDGDGNGLIVDKLSHIAQNVFGRNGTFTNPSVLLRGGNISLGYGCVTKYCDYGPAPSLIRLFAGPTDDQGNRNSTSYRGGRYKWQNSDPDDNSIPYTNASINRGWVKIEFPNTINLPQPSYAIKSKAVAIGDWDMEIEHQVSIPLSKVGISADRIVALNTTIQSDYTASTGGQAGWQLTDFNMHRNETPPSIQGESESSGGGITFIRDGEIRLLSSKRQVNGDWANHYSSRHSQKTNSNGTVYNRGWVKVDYLAGSCEQGPAGFKIQAVPGINVGNCAGTSQPFYIEGAGRGTPVAANNTTDTLTYVYKSSTAANLTISVRVEGFDFPTAHASALAGVMFRATLNSNSKNAAMMALHGSNAVSFRRRINDGSPTVASPGTAPQYYRWVRIQKSGNTFKAFMHSDNTPAMPAAGWTQVGPTETISFPTTYYHGLQVSNFDSPKLTKVAFRGYTETSP
jgi:hypothetical protein